MKFQVQMVATVRTYRIVTVEAWNPEDAKARARKLVRAPDADAICHEGEDIGEWCDSDEPTRARVLAVWPEKTGAV